MSTTCLMAGLLGLILGRGEKDSWKKHGVEDVHGPYRPKRDENTMENSITCTDWKPASQDFSGLTRTNSPNSNFALGFCFAFHSCFVSAFVASQLSRTTTIPIENSSNALWHGVSTRTCKQNLTPPFPELLPLEFQPAVFKAIISTGAQLPDILSST